MKKHQKQHSVWIYSTFQSASAAQMLAKKTIELKLCYCVNIISQIQSIYSYKDKIETCFEVGCYFKTIYTKKHRLISCIVDNHSYDIPCIFEIPASWCNVKYQDWALNSIRDRSIE